jgi:hypothetical protein
MSFWYWLLLGGAAYVVVVSVVRGGFLWFAIRKNG